MAEGNPPSGLLSKVAKFVTNPTKDWSDLEHKEADASGYSKESLKVMIERKRQNDFVRKREFDHLRKLRRRESATGPEDSGRPSFFQSSFTSNMDERAQTLKKIDEIEAQMSKQWWKGKGEPGASAGASMPEFSVPPVQTPAAGKRGLLSSLLKDGFESTIPKALFPPSQIPTSQVQTPKPQSRRPVQPPLEMAPTIPSSIHLSRAPARSPVAPAAPAGTPTSVSPAARGAIGAGFSSHRLYAVELADSLTDPDLEEAAIRFANGDDEGAEQGLLAALDGSALRPELAEAWMSALFDLYRATGQHDRFESVAIDFAGRFGRSAPAWFSTPDLLRMMDTTEITRKPGSEAGKTHWTSSAMLTSAALQDLQTVLQRGSLATPTQLDWQTLEHIEVAALPGLGSLFANLCEAQVALVFLGYEGLDRALNQLTPSGDRGVNPAIWQMRMDALRVMGRQDEFELVALEYCVTFEVSPPSWQAARCSCVIEGSADSDRVIAAEMENDAKSAWGGFSDTVIFAVDVGEPAQVELVGEILGDAAETLVRLEAGMEGATRIVISCARLIRVDFSAAGSILNWVAVHQGQGCQVQFRDVNRIVAAFFNVIGINEHARVVPRNA